MIVMREDATPEDVSEVVSRVESTGARAHVIEGAAQQVIGVIGDVELVRDLALEVAPGVDHTMPISRPFKLTSREFKPEDTVIKVLDAVIGDGSLTMMAGPTSMPCIPARESTKPSLTHSISCSSMATTFAPRHWKSGKRCCSETCGKPNPAFDSMSI